VQTNRPKGSKTGGPSGYLSNIQGKEDSTLALVVAPNVRINTQILIFFKAGNIY
jgi:hypothetical protein